MFKAYLKLKRYGEAFSLILILAQKSKVCYGADFYLTKEFQKQLALVKSILMSLNKMKSLFKRAVNWKRITKELTYLATKDVLNKSG